jgi:hypothetical protein
MFHTQILDELGIGLSEGVPEAPTKSLLTPQEAAPGESTAIDEITLMCVISKLTILMRLFQIFKNSISLFQMTNLKTRR